MKIVDFFVKEYEGKLLVFLSMEDEISDHKICYKQLNNIVYKINEDYCITNRRGIPIALMESLDDCSHFLLEEYKKDFTVETEIKFSNNEV